ncbi:prenyltransferase/squalene oxidase repeat-containing protein [Aeoliella mucimassa]|uniref:Prenyltransferase and squalene oxidase repeat protein n=1 Tax=Aeoliella mucimassa TaxID=2527972 RepID=A0A518AP81_9BACT|nr:prenyltransferase/squalene oxidase repeat-containing protein [Aeoliella mucimassa]QDU56528.1 Prenyltransferase and squalene oxidase repeat protein [Aeoliella mucimassa]
MLQVARLAPNQLGEATPLVENFYWSQLNDDGGFADRDGKSDLYYTAFGLQGLAALQCEVPVEKVRHYLSSFADGEGLDCVHTACLARCWASVAPGQVDPTLTSKLLSEIEAYRTPDGGYHIDRDSEHGDIYGCFLALGAYQDLGQTPPNPSGIVQCVQALRTEDGGYSNGYGLTMGLTPPTAAAETLLRHLAPSAQHADAEHELWLLRRLHPDGGFYALDEAPLPDLLSTATAIHALAGMKSPIEPLQDACLDFLDTLWTAQGGFYGTWEDDTLDCEYTYYGLLALGHLSL